MGRRQRLRAEEGLKPEKVKHHSTVPVTEREPLRDDVIAAMQAKPKILQRKKWGEHRALDRIMVFVRTHTQDAPE